MKKICYVVTIPLTIRAFFIPQLQYLSQAGLDVTVICSFDVHLQNELGNKIHFIPVDIPRGIAFGASINAIQRLTDIFSREKFDLVQYSTPNAAFYASVAAKRARIKARNYHLMGFRFLGASGIGRTVLKAMEKITCYYSTSIECVSRSNLMLGIQTGLFPKSKATVVWNGSSGGVDTKRFDYNKRKDWRLTIRKELGYDPTDFVFGFVGRITKDKGINELLTAFLSLNDGSKLFLLGEIEDQNNLDASLLDQAMKCVDVQFHDSVRDVERYYAAIDALVLPSYREGFGNVVIEAGAMGTPAIVTDIPGPIDSIEAGRTAYVVPVKDADALATCMRAIETSQFEEMGKRAAQYVKSHFESERLNEHILQRKLRLLEG